MTPCGEHVNTGFKQFVIAVDSYATTNPLWIIFQYCAVICIMSLTNMNRIKSKDFSYTL